MLQPYPMVQPALDSTPGRGEGRKQPKKPNSPALGMLGGYDIWVRVEGWWVPLLLPGGVSAEPQAGRMFEARYSILPWGFKPGHNSSASWRHPQPSEGGQQHPRPRIAGWWPYPVLPAALLCVSAVMTATQPRLSVSHGRARELRAVGSLETPGKQQNTGQGSSKLLQGACPLPILSQGWDSTTALCGQPCRH